MRLLGTDDLVRVAHLARGVPDRSAQDKPGVPLGYNTSKINPRMVVGTRDWIFPRSADTAPQDRLIPHSSPRPAGAQVERTARVPEEEHEQRDGEKGAWQQAGQPQPLTGDRDQEGGQPERQADAGQQTDHQDLPGGHELLSSWESDRNGAKDGVRLDILKLLKLFSYPSLAPAKRNCPHSKPFGSVWPHRPSSRRSGRP